jgi:hypothetical protein
LRLEDCLLTEQPGILKEFFGSRTGYLPEGSVLLFGSLSHLAMRGLESYAEETVRAYKVFSNMLKSGCSVAHVVYVPLGGIQSDGLIRDLYDLDSWLRSGIISTAASLPASRECFWRLAVEEYPVRSKENNMEHALFMPESLTKSNKIRIVSGATSNLLPDSIGPVSENFEKELISCILNEISETYAIEVDRNPALNRCSDDQVFYNKDTNDDRIFVVGASHTTRLVGGLAEKGFNVVSFAKGGWKINDETVADMVTKLKSYGAEMGDIILIDQLSNNVFCGTDSDGNHCDPVNIEGGWHITGNLCVRAKPYVKASRSKCRKIMDACPDAKIIFLAPIPQYILSPCCADPEHITNFTDPDYVRDISGELEKVEELLDALAQSCLAPSLVLSFRAVAADPESLLPDLTVIGNPIWQDGDPVHAAASLYAALVAAIHSGVEELGAGVPAAPKRPRLESIVVRSKNFAYSDPVSKPARPQGWSSGTLPEKAKERAPRGRGRG